MSKTRARRGWGSIVERDGKFYAQFINPRTRCRTMRLLKGVTKRRQADRALSTLRDEVEREALGPARTSETFASWFGREYAAILASRLAPGSIRSAGAHVQRFTDWAATNGNPTMDRIDRPAAERFVSFLIGEGLAPGYVTRLVTTLRRAWKDAAERGLAEGNPWFGIKVKRGDQRQVPWIEPEQLAALYANTNEAQRPLVVLLGETGLRVSEGLALRWADVNLSDRPTVHVRSGKTPSSRRTVPLSPVAVETLRALPRGEDEALVFYARSGFGVLKALRAACKRAEVPTIRVHDLRHVFASHLVQGGTPAPTVARILGHADGGALVLRLYGRWMRQDAEVAAVRSLAAFRSRPVPAAVPVPAGA